MADSQTTVPTITFPPGWLAQDVARANARLKEWHGHVIQPKGNPMTDHETMLSASFQITTNIKGLRGFMSPPSPEERAELLAGIIRDAEWLAKQAREMGGKTV